MSVKRAMVMTAVLIAGCGMAWAQTEWVEHPDNPVIGLGDPGTWDAGYREVGGVVSDGTMYHLYFIGDDEEDGNPSGIGHATSSDGVAWTIDPNNPVLTIGAEGEWDDDGIANFAVIYDDAEFHMWYGGWTANWAGKVGYATSSDGSVWAKYSGNPILEQGGPGSYDENGVFPDSVILKGDTYQMWYTAVDLPDFFFTVGYAESPDGISWTKHPGPVLQPGSEWENWDVGGPAVTFDGAIYHMWYTANGVVGNLALPTGIGYATSADGIEWAKYPENPVFAFDEDHQPRWPVVVFDGSAYRMWYEDWVFEGPPTGIFYATSDCCVAMNFQRFIPAAAVAAGAQGAFFQTDVDLSNADDRAAEYEFLWLPRGETNTDPMTSEPFSLGAGMSVRYSNVLSEVFDLEPNALGALMVRSSSPDLLAMSRTYNTPTGEPAGTYGQSMPAITPGDMIHTGERRRILFATENADMRTNIGCQSGSTSNTAVRLELFDMEGNSLATETALLRPLGNDQLNRVFEDYAPVSGYVEVWTTMPDRAFYCYGSVLDNTTSDPTTIPPQ